MVETTLCGIQATATILDLYGKIRLIATNVRNEMELTYGDNLAGHCIEASDKVVEAVFAYLGVKAKTVEGWCRFDDECYGSDHPWDPHTWVEIETLNLYIDVTADQFNYGMLPENEFPKIIVREGLPHGMQYDEPTWNDFEEEVYDFDTLSEERKQKFLDAGFNFGNKKLDDLISAASTCAKRPDSISCMKLKPQEPEI